MTTNLTSRFEDPVVQQARNARRVAVLLLIVVTPSLILFSFLSYPTSCLAAVR